jgi:hypothetical protein
MPKIGRSLHQVDETQERQSMTSMLWQGQRPPVVSAGSPAVGTTDGAIGRISEDGIVPESQRRVALPGHDAPAA